MLWKRPSAIIAVLIAASALALSLAHLVRTLSPASWADFESRVSRSVSEHLVRIAATAGDRLELASVETVETFRETDNLKLGWLDFGTTEVELRTPVVYRFHVALAEGLRTELRRHGDLARCVVYAPKLLPTLPPAVRTEGWERRAVNGWARFNAEENLVALEKSLTAELVLRAPAKSELARDKARAQLAGFVSRWLIGDGLWGGAKGVREIVVVFPGESPETMPPALTVLP